MDFVKFGEKLRNFREKLGLTQADLARKVGRDRGYISYIENGTKTPGLELAVRLAKAVGVELEDLIN